MTCGRRTTETQSDIPRRLPTTKQLAQNSRSLLGYVAKHPVRPTTSTLADCPPVARYYDPNLNGDIPLHEIGLYMPHNAAWRCTAIDGETHIWLARPQNFSRTVLKAEKATRDSLESRHKNTMGRLKALLDAGLEPTPGCPACTGKVATPTHNLLQTHPDVAQSWDYSKNTLPPQEYPPKSACRVYWRDPTDGHGSHASIVSRTQKNRVGTSRQGCGLMATKENNLLALFPRLAARLVSDVNGNDVDPAQISPKSNSLYLWRCESDERHPDSVAPCYAMAKSELEDTASKGCGYCRGFSLAPGCSLEDEHPEIAEEYGAASEQSLIDDDLSPNDIPASRINPASNERRSFQCSKCGHIWATKVRQRCKVGNGCPRCCIGRKVSQEQVTFFRHLALRFPQLIFETEDHTPKECFLAATPFIYDAVLPEFRIAIEYDGWYWHGGRAGQPDCEQKRTQDLKKNAFAETNGYTIIRIRCGLKGIGPFDVLTKRTPKPLENLVTAVVAAIERCKYSK